MAEQIQHVEYFYTEVPDKPGEGAKVLGRLKEAGINLLAFVGSCQEGQDKAGGAENRFSYPRR